MSGDNYQPLIDCPTVESITLIHVAKLENGATAVPRSESGRRWNLNKQHGGTPNGYSILRPAEGSPIAGADAARWILQAGGGSGSSSVIAQYYDALDEDTNCPADTSTPVASLMTIPITDPTSVVRVHASVGCLYSRSGVSSFFVEVNGILVTGAQVGYDVATLLEKSWSMVHQFTPVVGNNTVRLIIRPTGPLAVSVNAQSEPSVRHAHLAVTVFSGS